MALSEDILKLKDVFNGANPLQAGIDKAGGTLQLPNVQDIQAPQVAAPQPLMTPEFLAQREVDRGPMEDASMGGAIAGAAKSGFDFLFGAPTPEQAQDILNTQPTDAAQRARLQETAAGRGQPSDISQIGSFFFGRPDVAGDPNILGNQPTTPVAPQAGELGAVAQVAPSRPSSPAMDGSQIPKFGEEGFQFAERGSPQDFFLSQTKDGTQSLSQEQIERGQSFAQQKGMNFDPMTGFSVGEQPPVSQGLTTQGGQPLAEFLAGGQQLDPQGRMIDPSVDRSFFEQESAAREQRLAARPDFMEAVSDRDRRAARGDGISDADRRDMAQANQREASAGDVARGEKVAAALGVDLKTGQPLETGMTPYQAAQIELQKAGLGLKMTEAEAKAAGVSQKQYEKMAKAAGALQSLEADLNLVREKGEEIKDLTMKPRTQGLLAKALTKISPTSTAAQLERASGTLTGDAFIKGMRVIKEFGGGLGSVTEVEGMKVERAQGAIFEAGMSDAERRNAVDNYLEVRENAYNRIRGAFVDEFGEEQANRYLGGGAGQAAVSNGAIQVPTVEGVTIEEIN